MADEETGKNTGMETGDTQGRGPATSDEKAGKEQTPPNDRQQEEKKQEPNLKDYSRSNDAERTPPPEEQENDPEGKQSTELDENNRKVIGGIPVTVTAVVGTHELLVRDLEKMGRGAVIPLDTKLGNPIYIFANNQLVGKGELSVIEGGEIAITMVEITNQK